MLSFNEDYSSSNAPLSSILFSRIQKDILSGALKAGEKLTEQKICDRYKVSRTPVREALRQLEMASLIENIPNRGAFVIGFSKQDIIDIYDLRAAYEVQAVKWAIDRMSESEMEDLEEVFDFMEFYTMKNDMNKMLSINNNFHRSIYAGSHNRMLQETLSSYQLYIRYGNPVNFEDTAAYLETVLEEHRNIFEAIKAKDKDLAAEAMLEHMEQSKKRRLQYL